MRKRLDSATAKQRQQTYIDKMGREEYLARKRASTAAWRASLTPEQRRDLRFNWPSEVRKRQEAREAWDRGHIQ